MILSTRKVSSVTSELKYHVQQIPQQPGWWTSAHPSEGYENRSLPLVQAMRINQNCASPCKASGHLQKPYLKHRCPGWSTTAFPSPHSHRQTKLLSFCCRRDCFPSCPFLFVSACLFFFSVLAWNSQPIQKTNHSQQQPGFSSWYQLSPTHHCIPAKWWDCDALKTCTIHELWLQISLCNSWLNDSSCHHNGNTCHCSSVYFKVWSGAFFSVWFHKQTSYLYNNYFKMQFFSLPFSKQELCILP